VALKPMPDYFVWPFMLYILLSIVYYILIQKDFKRSLQFDISVFIISSVFTILINVNLFISLNKSFPNSSPSLTEFAFLLYFVVFTSILWAALRKR
jgi:hypothetical protein